MILSLGAPLVEPVFFGRIETEGRGNLLDSGY